MELVPARPFTITNYLRNYDTLTHTFTLERSSAQGWDYTYLLQPPGSPTTTPLVGDRVTVPGGGSLGIFGVFTPTTAISPTVRETYSLTATSTLSPTTVFATTYAVIVGPGYNINEGGPSPNALYIPAILKAATNPR